MQWFLDTRTVTRISGCVPYQIIKINVDSRDYNKEIWPAAVQPEILHDKFVFGLPDNTLKERLLCETKLMLAKAIEIGDKTCQRSK